MNLLELLVRSGYKMEETDTGYHVDISSSQPAGVPRTVKIVVPARLALWKEMRTGIDYGITVSVEAYGAGVHGALELTLPWPESGWPETFDVSFCIEDELRDLLKKAGYSCTCSGGWEAEKACLTGQMSKARSARSAACASVSAASSIRKKGTW